MRVVLLSLILANVLYWVWTRSSSPEMAVAQASIDPDLPSIELIKSAGDTDSIAANAMTDSDVDVVSLPLLGADDVVDVDAIIAEGDKPLNAVADQIDSTPDKPTELTGNQKASSSIGGAPPEATATTAPTAAAAVNTADAGNLIAAVDPVRFPDRCISIGPFNDLKMATETSSRLSSAGLETTQRIEQAEVWVGHWVYLPQFDSRSEAAAAVEKLRKVGVKDIYIEPSGELANTVSLGLFSDLERAEIRAGRIRKYDVRPQIQDRHRDGLVYYVDFPLSAGRRVNMAEIQNKTGPEAVKARRIECVASGVAEVS